LNATARTGVPDHAHNEFLHLWAETGAGGLVVFVVLAGAGLAKGACRAWREPAGSGLPVVGAVASVVATLVLGLVSYPLHLPLSAALFWVVIGFLWSEGSTTQPAQGRRMAG
jgi:O-antigen ligase